MKAPCGMQFRPLRPFAVPTPVTPPVMPNGVTPPRPPTPIGLPSPKPGGFTRPPGAPKPRPPRPQPAPLFATPVPTACALTWPVLFAPMPFWATAPQPTPPSPANGLPRPRLPPLASRKVWLYGWALNWGQNEILNTPQPPKPLKSAALVRFVGATPPRPIPPRLEPFWPPAPLKNGKKP